MKRGSVVAIVGAQHGSEGKGVVASRLARAHHFSAAVRVGGPNAGHSFYNNGLLYKMRSVPCAWIDPDTALIIGAGAVVNPHLLIEEAEQVNRLIYIDGRAALITDAMEHAESDIKDLIGSTGEGVGQARIAKIGRKGGLTLARDYDWSGTPIVAVDDASRRIDAALQMGDVMLEGTQGSALSLHHGSYPYVTSSDTNASGMAAEAGIAPSDIGHVFLVARTMPIRVGGNSGPMAHEVGWDGLISRGVVAAPERTTVTKKIRRIGEWDPDLYENALRLNRPCGTFLMFTDYLDTSIVGTTDWGDIEHSAPICTFMDNMLDTGHWVPIIGVGTGGPEWQIAGCGRQCLHRQSWGWS